MLEQILSWAANNDQIRSLLLVGSKSSQGKQDEWSDYDISLFGGPFPFIAENRWLDDLAPSLVCIHEKFYWGDWKIPTRLTIFEDYTKVDFAFHPMALLEDMVRRHKLSESYDAGYQILLDKDGLAANLPPPSYSAYRLQKPDAVNFSKCQDEFWFEAYHVAKHIARKDLWTSSWRSTDMKKWLLLMLEWNAGCKVNFDLRMKRDGKYLGDWIDPLLADQLPGCFAGWQSGEQYQALHHCVNLFDRLAKETAQQLALTYNEHVAKKLLAFIDSLKSAA